MWSFRAREPLYDTFPLAGPLDQTMLSYEDACHQSPCFAHDISMIDNTTFSKQSEWAVGPYILVDRSRQNSTSLTSSRPKPKLATCPDPTCGVVLLQKMFNRHMKSVHGPAIHWCAECSPPQSFPRKDSLDRHFEKQHSGLDDSINCWRCPSRVCRRSFKTHFRSRKCQEAPSPDRSELSGFVKSQSEFFRMLDAIVQEAEEDDRLLRWLGVESVHDPLIISLNFMCRAIRANWSGLKPPGTPWRTELVQLRGLSIRTVLRSIGNGEPDNELKLAMEFLCLAEEQYRSIDPEIDLLKNFYGMSLLHPCFREIIEVAATYYKPPAWDYCRVVDFRIEDEDYMVEIRFSEEAGP